MLAFISSQFIFYLTIALVLFVPGYFLLLATNLKNKFSGLENFVLSFSLSLVLVDFLLIILEKFEFPIKSLSILSGLFIFFVLCLASFFYFKQKKQPQAIETPKSIEKIQKSTLLIISLLFLTIFIKTIYLQDVIFPTATDMGHHMYWTQSLVTTGKLPIYEKVDILPNNTISKPAPIADFIIGEHLVFAAIALISGQEIVSAFPILILFLINIMSVLAMFILAQEFFKKQKNEKLISALTLFLIGPLYALASPQAKFVSGGVIGNTIGNLLIPIILLLLLKAFTQKRAGYFALAIFVALGLAYTHHLSTFVFLFIALFSLAFFLFLQRKKLKEYAQQWLSILLSPTVLGIICLALVFVFFVYTPTYLNVKAIDTAVGAPSKASRAGLTLTQLKSTAGEARFALAVIAILILALTKKINPYRRAFLLGWTASLSIMSLYPAWLFLDIPSDRIASYIIFPSAIVAAYTFIKIFEKIKTDHQEKNYLKQSWLFACFFLLLTFVATDGLLENSITLNAGNSPKTPLETYAASKYLATKIDGKDIIVKDHNYLSADSWIKLFFMRGYNFPFSRGYFKRYQDETKTREQCTNQMISLPNSSEAGQCFTGTGTNFVMLNPNNDAAQFQRLNNFWQVYTADDVAIFYKSK